MTLSTYLKMLYPFFGDRKGFGKSAKSKDGRSKADYVVFILGAIIEEDYNSECVVLDMPENTLRKLMSGDLALSAKQAIPLNAHIDRAHFCDTLSSDVQSCDSILALSQALTSNGIVNNGTLDDVVSKCADLLIQIIAEAASVKGHRNFSDACSAVEEALLRMPKPVIQTPPEQHADHEQQYIRALYEAYGDAVHIDCFDESCFESYPEYKEDLQERRIDYFSAESIRCSISELQGVELQDQFNVLKDETYAGVRNTAMRHHSDGYEKMLCVMEQASVLQVSQYLLSKSPYWISNRIKQGVCHFLVKDGKLRWVKKND